MASATCVRLAPNAVLPSGLRHRDARAAQPHSLHVQHGPGRARPSCCLSASQLAFLRDQRFSVAGSSSGSRCRFFLLFWLCCWLYLRGSDTVFAFAALMPSLLFRLWRGLCCCEAVFTVAALHRPYFCGSGAVFTIAALMSSLLPQLWYRLHYCGCVAVFTFAVRRRLRFRGPDAVFLRLFRCLVHLPLCQCCCFCDSSFPDLASDPPFPFCFRYSTLRPPY